MLFSPYLVGICGGSASGKSFVTESLRKLFTPEQLTLISLDNYYKPLALQPRNENGVVNFDHPDAIDYDAFLSDLQKLKSGETLRVKQYNFNNPNLPEVWLEYPPAPIVVVEGLLIYSHPALRSLFQLKVFIEADEHIKFSRRLRRDMAVRGYSLDDILIQYEETVVPMFRRYVEPYRLECHVILPNHRDLNPGLQVLSNHLMTFLF